MNTKRARKGKPWIQTRIHLRVTAPVLDPTFRGGDGNVGIIRSPVRAIALPDPWAAGTEYNLQRLFKRGSMPKEKRDQREWHMSPSERRLRGNSLGGDGSHVSPMEVTPKLGKGAPDTRRPPYHRVVAGLIKPAQCHDGPGGEAGGKPW